MKSFIDVVAPHVAKNKLIGKLVFGSIFSHVVMYIVVCMCRNKDENRKIVKSSSNTYQANFIFNFVFEEICS